MKRLIAFAFFGHQFLEDGNATVDLRALGPIGSDGLRARRRDNYGAFDAMIEIISILAWIGLAIGAGAIASSKGRSGFGFFLLGFFLPIVGILVAIGMSDVRASGPLGRPVKPNDLIICHSCRRPRRADAVACPHCSAGPLDPHAEEKKCPACAEWIKREAKKCKHCGEALETAAQEVGRAASIAKGMGYCPGCSKLRSYEVSKCVYCGNDSPVASMPSRVA